MKKNKYSIILASESPRRIEILKGMGLTFSIRKHSHTEEHLNIASPVSFVKECSLQKARSAVKSDREIVIGADTIVYLDGEIIGKPSSKTDAKKMLMKLSGKKHAVFTGLALITGEKTVTGVQKTDVCFREISLKEIESYLNVAEYMDKAGAYAVQEEASLFIEKIEGDFFNVVGFPVLLFSKLFEAAAGVELYKTIWKKRVTQKR
ncbi:MAG: Maf family protein [bacterium]|nr:Maf family protein [bacterium]